MRTKLLRAGVAVAIATLVACASAYALTVKLDNMVLSSTAAISPRVLPDHGGGGPVTVGSTTRIKTIDGSAVPTLKELTFELDKHGSIDTKGLPVCSLAKLADTTPAVARKRCAGAIVGEGIGRAEVNIPGTPRMAISSPLTFFNGAPQGGKPTLLVHAYETVPVPQTLLVPVAIERIKHGRYGYRVEVPIPEIAGGFGSATLAKATIGTTWRRGGRTVGYANAYCDGGRLQVQGVITFTDGSRFPGTLTSPCHSAG